MNRPAALLLVLLAASAAHAQPCVSWFVPPNGPNGRVDELVRYNGKLIGRGSFTNASGNPVKGVALFDGSFWSPMNLGLETVGSYTPAIGGGARNTIAAWRGKVYAIGSTSSPATSGGGVWDGSAWVPWHPFLLGTVSALPTGVFALSDGSLLVDGAFNYYNGAGELVRRRRLAKWNGATFLSLSTTQYGPRVNPSFSGQTVQNAIVHEGKLLLFSPYNLSTGPEWNSTDIPVPNGIITFDGTSFAPHPAPALNGVIRTAVVFNDDLYVAGDFTATADNSVPLRHIAKLSGNQWVRCAGGVSRTVFTLAVGDDGTGEKLHVLNGGDAATIAYNNPASTTVDTVSYAGAVRFDGVRFTAYGSGNFSGYIVGTGNAAASMDPGTGPTLCIGGSPFSPDGAPPPMVTFAVRRRTPSPDTDGDGLLDSWEQNGLDVDCNGVIDLDLPAMGANWRHKDVFVEVDAMLGRAPSQATLDRVVAAFAAAPAVLINNPDGLAGVKLHLIVDPEDQNIPLQNFPNHFADFNVVKAARFGNAADRTGSNRFAILDAKRQAFRYCIFSNTHDGGCSSGRSEIKGNDFMVTLGCWPTPGGTSDQQAVTFMHELGHTLGLYHGGHQRDESRFNFKPNYHSIMNYAWQLRIERPGWRLDYSRQALPTLDEHLLDELDGIGGDPASLALAGPLPAAQVPESGAVDWNRSDTLTFPVVVDINHVNPDYPPGNLDVLEGSEDWSRLFYNFRTSPDYLDGSSIDTTADEERMTPQLDAYLNAIGDGANCADIGRQGGLPGSDGLLDNNDFVVFINLFFAAAPGADLGRQGGAAGSDGFFDNNDFIVYINRFFDGC